MCCFHECNLLISTCNREKISEDEVFAPYGFFIGSLYTLLALYRSDGD